MSRSGWWAAGLVSVAVGAQGWGIAGAAAQTPVPPAPKDFLADALASYQYEALAAQVATAEAADPRVKAFAQGVIQAHPGTVEAIRKLAAASGVQPPPDAMSADQAKLLEGLQGVRGAAFDKAYARQQVLLREQAVAVDESFAASGSDRTIRDAAQSALPAIRSGLESARQLQAEVGGT